MCFALLGSAGRAPELGSVPKSPPREAELSVCAVWAKQSVAELGILLLSCPRIEFRSLWEFWCRTDFVSAAPALFLCSDTFP